MQAFCAENSSFCRFLSKTLSELQIDIEFYNINTKNKTNERICEELSVAEQIGWLFDIDDLNYRDIDNIRYIMYNTTGIYDTTMTKSYMVNYIINVAKSYLGRKPGKLTYKQKLKRLQRL
jgi:hypothetical protein